MTFAAHLGRNIARARVAAGLSQSMLAERLNVHRQTVYSWESGRKVPPTQQLVRIAAAVLVKVGALLPKD